MRRVLKVIGILVVVVLVLAGTTILLAKSKAAAIRGQIIETHRVEFPVPFQLSAAELDELRAAHAPPPAADGAAPTEPPPDPLAGLDLHKIAMERAVARGKHLVESRYACGVCHGADFSGGVMAEDPMLGSLHGPNITAKGLTASFKSSDWDRAVRHGVLPDGKVSMMPCDDFKGMSDRELSDVVAYIQSQPGVQKESPPVTLGPLGSVLVWSGKIKPAAFGIDHKKAHVIEPPPEGLTPQFGQHLAQICTGCHQADFAGGKIDNGPPSWPPAANITPAGLKGYTFEDFQKVLTTAEAPGGRKLREPMTLMPPVAGKMTDVEMRALWAYLQTVPSKAVAEK